MAWLNFRRAETIAAIILSAVVLFLLAVQAGHAGALWRDECDSLQLARMPTAGEVLTNAQYTSFPALLPFTLRAYTAVWGESDRVMRVFGLLVGAAFIAIAWFYSKTLLHEPPLILPALVGLNTVFLTVGPTIRGYGLGGVLIVLAFTLTAKFLRQPSKRNLAAVFAVYLASMHVLYFNGALLPAVVLAALVVSFRRKQFLPLLGIALLCGMSYIPYLVRIFFGTKNYAVVLRSTLSFAKIRDQLIPACGDPIPVMAVVWLSVVAFCIIAVVWRLAAVKRSEAEPERDLLLFALVTILAGVTACYAFMQVLHNEPNARYFLALFCLVAVAADLIIGLLSRFPWIRIGRIILTLALTATLPWAVWSKITQRQTNIDVVAQKLQAEAGPNDLIVINPWSLGTSFYRYYHGPARWMTVPQLGEHRINRYDLLKQKMAEFFPIDDVEREMRATLRGGNRVWIVGGIRVPPPGRTPMVLTPAPDPQFGWDISAYRNAWSEQIGALLQRHATRVDLVVAKGRSVNEHENVPLLAAWEWRN